MKNEIHAPGVSTHARFTRRLGLFHFEILSVRSSHKVLLRHIRNATQDAISTLTGLVWSASGRWDSACLLQYPSRSIP